MEISKRIGAPQGRGVLRDAIYGAIDGTVTTFAIVAGVAGAGLSPFVVVVLGLANVLADGFSMAAANYSGIKAEQDNYKRIRKIEERHISEYPKGEWLEVREILSRKGLDGEVLDKATDAVTQDRENWIALMMEGEYGMGGIDPMDIFRMYSQQGGGMPRYPLLYPKPKPDLYSHYLQLTTFNLLMTHYS
jgi:hypothetical protein